MKTRLSNWREESDLFEIVTGKMTDKEALKKVSEKKGIQNKVIINPSLKEAIEDIGGEVVSVDEALAPSTQELQIMKKINRLQLRLQKQKKKTTGEAEKAAKDNEDKEKEDKDIPVQQEEVGISSSAAMEKARNEAKLKAKEEAAVKKAKKVKEEVVNELKTSTYHSYIQKASIDAVGRGVDAGIKGMTGPKKDMEKNMTKAYKRQRGINTAATKLARRAIKKEEVELDERLGGKGYKSYTSLTGKKVSGDWEDSDRGAGNKATRRAGGEVKAKSPTYLAHVHNKKKKKGHDCASKVKHEEYGIGNCIKEMHTLDEDGHVTHYDVMFSNKIIKNVPVSSLEILEGMYHEHYVNDEKNKEVVLEKDLNAKERRALPDSDFVFPGKGEGPEGKQRGAYPIPDKKHARNALAMAAAHASPAKQAKVKAAVKKKFPGIKVSESKDRAFDMVVSALRKKHGKDAVITKDSPKPKPPTEAQKKKAAAERKKRQDADNKAYAARAKKAGFKSTQDYTNVVARYGSEDNYKKGRGLGT